jgi:hypothetical protein
MGVLPEALVTINSIVEDKFKDVQSLTSKG